MPGAVSTFIARLRALFDRWSHVDENMDHVQILRHRILLGFILLQIVLQPLWALGAYFNASLSQKHIEFTLHASLLISAGYVLTLLFFERKGHFIGSTNMMLMFSCLGVASAMVVSENAVANLETLLVSLIVLAFLLLGSKGGWAWAAIVFSTLVLVDHVSSEFPDLVMTYESGQSVVASRIVWLVFFVSTLFMLWMFSSVNQRAMDNLSAERDHFFYKAVHDDLTGLGNRHLFDQALPEALGNADNTNTLVGLLFIDLDDFKQVNDNYGHDVGDRFLREMAKRVKSCLRQFDVGARLGGDEYGILLTNLSHSDDIEVIQQRVAKVLQKPLVIDSIVFPAKASIGAALYPNDARTAEELMCFADAAMYANKRGVDHRMANFSIANRDR